MTRALLDVNVLIALVDPDHLDHDRVHAWATEGLADGWASCAMTQNGVVRIMSQPAYPGAVSVCAAVDLLRRAQAASNHEFWGCEVSLADSEHIDESALLGHRQVTDAYLLALAVHHDARLITLDRAVPLRAARGAQPSHLVTL